MTNKPCRRAISILTGAALSLLMVPAARAVSFNQYTNLAANPPGGPAGVVAGPDNALWVTDAATNVVVRWTYAGVPTTNVVLQGGAPFLIVVGPDNNLWFTEPHANRVGCISTNGALLGEFTIPTAGGGPYGITVGPDNRIWFNEYWTNKIGVISTNAVLPGATNFFQEYTLPNHFLSQFITVGPDSNLWITVPGANALVTLSTNGTLLKTNNVPSYLPGLGPMVTGPDNALWFTEYNIGAIARFTTDGAYTNYYVPTRTSGPNYITVGPDRNLWFTEYNTSEIGAVTTNGVMLGEFPTPVTYQYNLISLTTGADGNLWLPEYLNNLLDRVVLTAPLAIHSTLVSAGGEQPPVPSVVLSWPTNGVAFPNYEVQAKTAFGPGGWTTLTNVPSLVTLTNSGVVTNYYSVTIPVSGTEFFRVIR